MNEIFWVGVSPGIEDVLGNASYPHKSFQNGQFSLTQAMIPDLGFLPFNSNGSMGLLETIEVRFCLDVDPFKMQLTGSSYDPNFTPYTLSKLSGNDQALWSIYCLLLESIIMQIMAAYLETVVPSAIGVAAPWHWPITQFFQPEALDSAHTTPTPTVVTTSETIDMSVCKGEDSDVIQEFERVSRNIDSLIGTCPLVIHSLKKKYPGLDTKCKQKREIKMALNGISFAVEQGVVFGLLG
ncbi:hypothetical protein HDU98_003073 [Podochytrium sp. JEL0797]|nr:hypothetical protein HDU98_003073 [Podochytrium sp. JEL0797]